MVNNDLLAVNQILLFSCLSSTLIYMMILLFLPGLMSVCQGYLLLNVWIMVAIFLISVLLVLLLIFNLLWLWQLIILLLSLLNSSGKATFIIHLLPLIFLFCKMRRFFIVRLNALGIFNCLINYLSSCVIACYSLLDCVFLILIVIGAVW